jgi:hypothetical protein
MQIGSHNKLQLFPSEIQCHTSVTTIFGKSRLQMLLKNESPLSCDHHSLGGDFQKFNQATGVIRFRVIHNDIINGCRVADRLQIFQILVPFRTMHRFDNSDFLRAANTICIISRAKFSMQNDIKRRRLGLATPMEKI